MGILKKVLDRVSGKVPKGAKRSPRWQTVRSLHLLAESRCAVCGGNDKLEVHHIVPFNVDPSMELYSSNLITLCESKRGGVNCHLFFGHLGNYSCYNISIKSDAVKWNEKISLRIKSTAAMFSDGQKI